jgi:hypothetical protein
MIKPTRNRFAPAPTATGRMVWELDWNLLRTFLVIVEENGITAAANRLRLKQPTVSHALKRLEDRLGKRLAVRSPGAFEVTPAGALLYDAAVEIFSSVARLGVLVRDMDGQRPDAESGDDHPPHFLKARRNADHLIVQFRRHAQERHRPQCVGEPVRIEGDRAFAAQIGKRQALAAEQMMPRAAEEAEIFAEQAAVIQLRVLFVDQADAETRLALPHGLDDVAAAQHLDTDRRLGVRLVEERQYLVEHV